MTKQRTAIVQVLRGRREFASAAQIYDSLRAGGSTIGLATVYRTLGTLAADGDLDSLQHPGSAETLYRACADDGHHHHLTCRECGQAVEVRVPEVEAFAREIAAAHGFEDVEHTLEIAGTCETCRRSFA
ncbi:MAG: transcriptional repressor [Bifidobacteriaceae bacterium]|jgi:Fur family ferric uptake transcriptional regulator|nr:transcriptional repressor [Bifidobacteriaceae bacterium]